MRLGRLGPLTQLPAALPAAGQGIQAVISRCDNSAIALIRALTI